MSQNISDNNSIRDEIIARINKLPSQNISPVLTPSIYSAEICKINNDIISANETLKSPMTMELLEPCLCNKKINLLRPYFIDCKNMKYNNVRISELREYELSENLSTYEVLEMELGGKNLAAKTRLLQSIENKICQAISNGETRIEIICVNMPHVNEVFAYLTNMGFEICKYEYNHDEFPSTEMTKYLFHLC